MFEKSERGAAGLCACVLWSEKAHPGCWGVWVCHVLIATL